MKYRNYIFFRKPIEFITVHSLFLLICILVENRIVCLNFPTSFTSFDEKWELEFNHKVYSMKSLHYKTVQDLLLLFSENGIYIYLYSNVMDDPKLIKHCDLFKEKFTVYTTIFYNPYIFTEHSNDNYLSVSNKNYLHGWSFKAESSEKLDLEIELNLIDQLPPVLEIREIIESYEGYVIVGSFNPEESNIELYLYRYIPSQNTYNRESRLITSANKDAVFHVQINQSISISPYIALSLNNTLNIYKYSNKKWILYDTFQLNEIIENLNWTFLDNILLSCKQGIITLSR